MNTTLTLPNAAYLAHRAVVRNTECKLTALHLAFEVLAGADVEEGAALLEYFPNETTGDQGSIELLDAGLIKAGKLLQSEIRTNDEKDLSYALAQTVVAYNL